MGNWTSAPASDPIGDAFDASLDAGVGGGDSGEIGWGGGDGGGIGAGVDAGGIADFGDSGGVTDAVSGSVDIGKNQDSIGTAAIDNDPLGGTGGYDLSTDFATPSSPEQGVFGDVQTYSDIGNDVGSGGGDAPSGFDYNSAISPGLGDTMRDYNLDAGAMTPASWAGIDSADFLAQPDTGVPSGMGPIATKQFYDRIDPGDEQKMDVSGYWGIGGNLSPDLSAPVDLNKIDKVQGASGSLVIGQTDNPDIPLTSIANIPGSLAGIGAYETNPVSIPGFGMSPGLTNGAMQPEQKAPFNEASAVTGVPMNGLGPRSGIPADWPGLPALPPEIQTAQAPPIIGPEYVPQSTGNLPAPVSVLDAGIGMPQGKYQDRIQPASNQTAVASATPSIPATQASIDMPKVDAMGSASASIGAEGIDVSQPDQTVADNTGINSSTGATAHVPAPVPAPVPSPSPAPAPALASSHKGGNGGGWLGRTYAAQNNVPMPWDYNPVNAGSQNMFHDGGGLGISDTQEQSGGGDNGGNTPTQNPAGKYPPFYPRSGYRAGYAPGSIAGLPPWMIMALGFNA